jgi:hypothetical protein
MEGMDAEAFAIARNRAIKAESLPRCDVIATLRRSLIGAGGQQYDTGSDLSSTHDGESLRALHSSAEATFISYGFSLLPSHSRS